MSSVHKPQEKKRFAYQRDHYNRNGESNKAWRKTKPLKKAKARRAFRKASNDLLRLVGDQEEGAPESAVEKQGSLRQQSVGDWGAIHLKAFVATRRVRNGLNKNDKKERRARSIRNVDRTTTVV